MAFDGSCCHALAAELDTVLSGARINKIAQPGRDELLFTLKCSDGSRKLYITANASLPLLYLTDETRQSPAVAPAFCMLLRKYISGGRITAVKQLGFERVIAIYIEHLDELNDPAKKVLYIELMGKYSNIIFCDDKGKILDAIKRIGGEVSSVRLVLPGQDYFIPAQEGRIDPLSINEEEFNRLYDEAKASPDYSDESFLCGNLTGFGRVLAHEVSYRRITGLYDTLYTAFSSLISELSSDERHFAVYSDGTGEPKEFSLTESYSLSAKYEKTSYDSVSALLYDFYSKKAAYESRRQRTGDLRKHINILLERNEKKLALQKKQLKDTDKADRYRIYGELLHTYGYGAKDGDTSITVDNYYTGEKLTIPLDPTRTPNENASAYFARYEKLKRQNKSLSSLIVDTDLAVKQLSSILHSLDLIENEADLAAIKNELIAGGFMKKPTGKKTASVGKSRPLHFVTEDGFHIYVGKNNAQNDELTFKLATGNDWWFHAKQMPGSHVIVKTEGRPLPDEVFEIAASVAAYYSSGRDSEKLEVDYVEKKQIKKPNRSAPGFVVYYTNYSMTVKPELKGVSQVVV